MKTKFFLLIVSMIFGSSLIIAQVKTDSKPMTQKEKVSYIFGLNAGSFMKQQGYEFDLEALFTGIEDVLKEKPNRLTDAEINQVMMQFKREIFEALAKKNREKGIDFLKKNKKREGVIETKSGLQYEIIQAGTGEKPNLKSSVTVHYRGTLINGKEFDSSYGSGKPITFSINGVIPGWTEALQLMKKGAKWKIYVPSNLAYREYGAGKLIGPNESLIFEIELLEIK